MEIFLQFLQRSCISVMRLLGFEPVAPSVLRVEFGKQQAYIQSLFDIDERSHA